MDRLCKFHVEIGKDCSLISVYSRISKYFLKVCKPLSTRISVSLHIETIDHEAEIECCKRSFSNICLIIQTILKKVKEVLL